jgi:hypothetical protein
MTTDGPLYGGRFEPHITRYWPTLNGYQIVLKLTPAA